MTWARLDDRANEHRKQLAAGPEACWLWACGLMYCNRQAARNGFIPEQALRILYPLKSPSRLATKLVDVGLWERIDGGYQVHEFECWNKSKEQVEADRESTRNRVTAHRERKRGTQIGEKKLENDQQIGEKQSVILQQSEALSRLTNSRFRGIHCENERSNADCNAVTPNDCNAVSNTNVLDPLHSTPTPRVISNPAAAASDPRAIPRATGQQPQQSPEKWQEGSPIQAKIPCPADLQLTEGQQSVLEMNSGVPAWAIKTMTTDFVCGALADETERRPLEVWRKCLAKAVAGNWQNPAKRPAKPEVNAQQEREKHNAKVLARENERARTPVGITPEQAKHLAELRARLAAPKAPVAAGGAK